MSMLWLDVGLGKLQPNSEPVLTPRGWCRMGDLVLGDLVIGSDGKPTEILGVFPHKSQEIVKVTFTDGSWTRCGWDHLWYVEAENHRRRNQVGHVMTTRQLVDGGLTVKVNDASERSKWYVPMVQPVEYAPVNLELDPYLMGVILGDGTIAAGGSVTVCTDKEIIRACKMKYLRDHKTGEYTGYGSCPGIGPVMRSLRLARHRSWEKFIPEHFLLGSPEQRLALLQGLLDTDGSPIDKGGVEFSSTSENLTDGVVELAQSLGGIAKKKGPRITTFQNGEGRPSWRVNVKLPGHLTPFRLRRKLAKWVRPTKYQPIRKIVSVEVDGREEATCIKVAAADSLYVTRSFIITHNTIVTLTNILERIDRMDVYGTLVVAPLRVCQTVWMQEAKNWAHTQDLTFSLIHGVPRDRHYAMRKKADIYLVNYENLAWLVDEIVHVYLSKGEYPPFNMVVYDEISKMKDTSSNRVLAMGQLLSYFPYRMGLTATPASNGYKDLFGQYFVLDSGQRLGTNITTFKDEFFNAEGYMGYDLETKPGAEDLIKMRIADITLQMSNEDYAELPEVVYNDIMLKLSPAVMEKYEQLESDMFLELESGNSVEVFNAAALTNKCLQAANGALYLVPGSPEWDLLHDVKLQALEDIVEESSGQPILCLYAFKSDRDRIMKKFPHATYLGGPMTTAEVEQIVQDWTDGKTSLLIGHPASLAHGLNLQYGGHTMVWFGLNWSLELYDQAIGRLVRQGQKYPVIVHRLLAEATLDEAVRDALFNKAVTQTDLKNTINKYRRAGSTTLPSCSSSINRRRFA